MGRILHVAFVALLCCVSHGQPLTPKAEKQVLLAPSALAGEPSPFSTRQLRTAFMDPAPEYRSMPLWVWNDALEWPRLKEQLGQFKQQGMGGVFVHPRPGLMTEYLGAEWFNLWRQAIAEGQRLGLLVNIYDENSYPSGFSGGHVPARAPDTAAQYVQADLDVSPRSIEQRRGATVSFFAVKRAADGAITEMKRVTRAEEIPAGWMLVAFRLRRASGNPWTGGFPYVDLTNPRTTPAFLETTYEQYKKHFGAEFGRTVKWAFTDEPLISTAGAYDNAPNALPLSYYTLSEFRKRNGYDLADSMPSLYWDVGEFQKVRFDYWQTVHDLWKENFMRPMFLWNDKNNLQFTGHWMEHEWPYPWITPADASLYAYQHVPGIDMLEGTKLRLEGHDAHLLFTIRQVASVSHQLGRRAFCEAYGVAGWDSTLEHYKRFGDWLMVHGVNFMNQHLAFSTVRGARKRDHPQSFSDVSAWWPYYRLHGDHLGRVSMLSSRSTPKNRLLVLQQTTSGFLMARRGAPTPEMEAMRANNAALNQFLADHQVDYDLGDEYMIEWFGAQQGKRFTVGKADYDLLVVPSDMINVRSQTLPHLERWLAAGGEVISLSPPAAFVDGRPSDKVKLLADRYPNQWRTVANLGEMLSAVRTRIAPRVQIEQQPLPNVGLFERFLSDGGRVLFAANSGLTGVSTRATTEGASVELLDTVTGEISPAAFSVEGGKVTFSIDLAPAGSMAYLVSKADVKPQPVTRAQYTKADAAEWTARPNSPNVLVLDYCDVKVGADTWRDINTWQANWNIWQRHGFERPAWDNAVQFKTGIFDRNKFGADSGFDVTYRFTVVDAAAIAGMQLAMETPELYRVTLNGSPVDFARGDRWLDPHLLSVVVEKLVKTGENTVVVSAKPFDVKMELENIYIRGNFAVEPAAKGFVIRAARPLRLGSWAQQGMPFYSDSVQYETAVTVPSDANSLRVEFGERAGSVVSVHVDGRQAAIVAWQPWSAEIPVTAGRHRVAITVVSTPRNTMGPFHNPAKLRMRAWPAAWAEFPDHQPPGGKYDLLDYGMMASPVLSTGKRL